MRDDQIDALMRSLDRRFEPDPGFSETLFAALTSEVGMAGSPRRRWQLFPQALGRGMQLVFVLLIVGLLAVLLAAVFAIGGGLRGPKAIVERSQAVQLDPEPFEMTSRFTDGSEVRYRYDGSTMRIDVLSGAFLGQLPAGSYVIRNATSEAQFYPQTNEWSEADVPSEPAVFQVFPTWIAPVTWAPGAPAPLVECANWELGSEAEIAGRTAHEIRCGEDSYWIDRDSGTLLRQIVADDALASGVEVMALDTDPTFDPAIFAFDPPPGAITGEEPIPVRPQSDVLAIGEPAPPWSGSLMDGSDFSTESLIGRPSALYIWCSCYWGAEPQQFAAEARARSDSMNLVLVGSDREGMVSGLVDWLGLETPVVADYNGDLIGAWGLSDLGALILLRDDGTVADIHPARFDGTQLSAVLDALAAGDPIPEPPPLPVVSDEDTVAISTVLEVGQPAPELRGPLLGGGELSTDDLAGTPTVIAFFEPPDPVFGPVDDSPTPDALIDVVAAQSGATNLLLIAHGESTPGAVQAYVGDRGVDVDVVFDWDGSLLRRWGVTYVPTLVLLDADGSVAAFYGPQSLADPAPIIDAFVNGDPLPSLEPFAP